MSSSVLQVSSPEGRIEWIDHLRAGTLLLLLWDHSLHAYADVWGRFHFFRDLERTGIWDVFYMHDNSVIMPLLFFTFGLFLFPHVQKVGMGGFWKNRFFKLGIPYILGIPFVVPLLSYPKFHYAENPLMGYGEFWWDVYFAEKIQGGGPFWVLYCLALFSVIALLMDKILPFLRPLLGRLMKKAASAPAVGIGVFILISMALLGLGDILWGAPWWVGFGQIAANGETSLVVVNKILRLFGLQGSRFMLNALYFTLGIALSQAGLTYDNGFWKRVSAKWGVWLGLMVVFGAAYIWYSLTYFDAGAYNDAPHRLVDMGGTWGDAWPLLKESAPMTLARTSLHGIFCTFQVLFYVSLFHRFVGKRSAFWAAYTPCAYGIFLLHEIPVIWGQMLLADVHMPSLIKILIVGGVGLSLTWAFVALIRRAAFVRKVLG